jgi:hypothetical protein
MLNRGSRNRQGRNDWHQRAAEFHDLAAHAHRTAATHYDKDNLLAGRKFSKQAIAYSAKAFKYAQQAHEKSESTAAGAVKAAGAKPVAQANGAGKNGKNKG